MLEAMRNRKHRNALITERLKRGVYPYQPFGAAPAPKTAPVLAMGSVADAEPIASFLTSARQELSLLGNYGDETASLIQWSLRHLMQATRPESLLGSFESILSRNALLFPSLGFAISPPSRWSVISLNGARIVVASEESFKHMLPESVADVKPGDPLGVVYGEGVTSVTFTLASAQVARLLFVPLHPVVDSTLSMGGLNFLPMKTKRGLYFWLGQQRGQKLTLTLKLSEQAVLIGAPLIADGEWTQAGEVSAMVDQVLSPVVLNATASGAIFSIRTTNIQEWTEVATSQPVALPVEMKTQVSFPTGDAIVIPAGFVPRKIYRGHRSWYMNSYTKDGSGNWALATSSYLPLEGTNFELGANDMIKMRTYLNSSRALTLDATINGIVTVNGVTQPSGRIVIPTGDSELAIELRQGSHHFFISVPPDINMRARYTMPRYQLAGASVVMENAPSVPHELVLVSNARSPLQVRVGLPVLQGRPAIVADLQVS